MCIFTLREITVREMNAEILAEWQELDHMCLLLSERAVKKRSIFLVNSLSGKNL